MVRSVALHDDSGVVWRLRGEDFATAPGFSADRWTDGRADHIGEAMKTLEEGGDCTLAPGWRCRPMQIPAITA